MTKRVFGILLCLALLTALIPDVPTPVRAASEIDHPAEKIYLGCNWAQELPCNAGDPNTFAWGDSIAHYDPETGVLTLTDWSNDGCTGYLFADNSKAAGIFADGDLIVRFVGNMRVCVDEIGKENYGIYVTGDLIIENLSAEDQEVIFAAEAAALRSVAIWCGGDLTIRNTGSGSLTVNARHGAAWSENAGVYCGGEMTVSSGVTLNGTTVMKSIMATVVLPMPGEHPVSAGVSGDESKYKVRSVDYYSSSGKLQPTDTFAAGNTYKVRVEFQPVGDYAVQSSVISRSTSATVNGLSASYWSRIDNGSSATYYFQIEYTMPDISVTITLPAAGAHPVSAGISGDESAYKLLGVSYYLDNGSTAMKSTDTFLAGRTYRIYAEVKPVGDYAAQSAAFSSSTSARVNGLPASYWSKTDNGSSVCYNFRLEYTVPAAGPYTVTYAPNGGGGVMTPNPVMVLEEGALTLPECTFTPPGEDQEFYRWDAGSPGDRITVSGNLTVKALWKEKDVVILDVVTGISETGTILPAYGDTAQYMPTVTFPGEIPIRVEPYMSDSGTGKIRTWMKWYEEQERFALIAAYTETFTEGVRYKLCLTLYVDRSAGYKFDSGTRFMIDGQTWDVMEITNTASTSCADISSPEFTLTKPTFTVTFHSGGGTAVSSQSVVYGEKVLRPADPERAGYCFEGWYRDSDLTVPFDFGTEIHENRDLYAGWTKLHTVSFVSFGGTEIPAQTVKDGEKAARPADPEKPGFAFGGWYADSGLTTGFSFSTAIEEDTTLYAKWLRLFTVTFESGGGTEIPAQTVREGGRASRPADPDRDGYVFTGWYTDAGLTAGFDFGTPIAEDTSLYAGWVKLHQVTFDSGGGTAVPPQTVRDGEKAVKPEDPAWAEYAFAGWYGDSARTEPFSFDTPIGADTVLYAKWESQEILSVSVSVSTPAIGSRPDFRASVISDPESAADPARTEVTWFKIPETEYAGLTAERLAECRMNETERFEAGYYYFVTVSVNAKTGSVFTASTSVSINGKDHDDIFFAFFDRRFPTSILIGANMMEPVAISGAVRRNRVTYAALNAPDGALLIAAQYDNGRMTALRTVPVVGTRTGTLTMPGSGEDFKLMLVDALTMTPLCRVWDSGAGT